MRTERRSHKRKPAESPSPQRPSPRPTRSSCPWIATSCWPDAGLPGEPGPGAGPAGRLRPPGGRGHPPLRPAYRAAARAAPTPGTATSGAWPPSPARSSPSSGPGCGGPTAAARSPLETYARLQSPDAMPRAVLRRMVRGVSTRDYAEVVDAGPRRLRRGQVERQPRLRPGLGRRRARPWPNAASTASASRWS